MNTATFAIEGGDYAGGGSASKSLKEMLKRIGADAQAIRRTMVAAYEAEMNVVIHAHRGLMKAAVDPSQVDVVVMDEGPGIPNVEMAMKEGFSTAPAAARDMGFGAGMGLPNIERNTDRFSIHSTVGKGTQVRFTILLKPSKTSGPASNSVFIDAARCRQCLMCLHACPTAAVRVRGGQPSILEHLCVDCTSCIAVCEARALALRLPGVLPAATDDTVLVLPTSFLEQFGGHIRGAEVLQAVADLGYRNVRLTEEWETALRQAVAQYAQEPGRPKPVLTPMCPAVVNLVRTRFPSLIPHLAPFRPPIEAAREEVTAPHAVFVPVCPSQQTLLNAQSVLTRVDLLAPAALCGAVLARLDRRGTAGAREDVVSSAGEDALQVSGMRHVLKVLNEVEDGLMGDYPVLELYACDQGCFGSPVWSEDPFVARRRWTRQSGAPASDARPFHRIEPALPRPGLRLDEDMSRAIEKLARMDALTEQLPGRNCGVCGAPTCAALAEDVVMGRAEVSACVYHEEGVKGEKGQRGKGEEVEGVEGSKGKGENGGTPL